MGRHALAGSIYQKRMSLPKPTCICIYMYEVSSVLMDAIIHVLCIKRSS